MGVAYGVDVVLLHQLDIFQHQFAADRTAQLRMFMAVGPFHQCRYAVHAEAAVFDFGRAEAYSASGQFGFFATSVFQGEDERVQVRMFGTPGFYTGDCRFFEYNPAVFSSRDFSFLFQDGFAVGIFQLVSDAGVRIGRTGNLNVQVKDTVLVSFLVESGNYFVVGNILSGRAVKVDAPFDTAQAPHVLAFQVGTAAPAIDFQGYSVLARFQLIGNIPFCRGFRTLVIS